ncbi:Leucine Rich Repeat domain protein, partial [Aspergillus nomiae NRRL 13137]
LGEALSVMEKLNNEDGQLFIKNLASFQKCIHSVELVYELGLVGFGGSLSFGALKFTSQTIKPAKLTLTPHHLFYLLSRFEDLSIAVGPMNVRLENIHTDVSQSYVSFLNKPQRSRGDRDSIHSVSSVRSVMSGMSALWSSFGLGSKDSVSKSEKAKAALEADLKYLYSAFTKIPCLRLAPDRRARLIRGYEEFPFDTAVPLHSFKNLGGLEIIDIDFRSFYGWDRLSEQLRTLTVKRAKLEDPADLLTRIVLDDIDKRRRRSSKNQQSPVLGWSGHTYPQPVYKSDLSGSISAPGSPVADTAFGTSTSPQAAPMLRSSNLAAGGLPPSKWQFLRHLGLPDNSLTSITAAGLAPVANTLYSLDLSANLFTEVPDSLATLVALRALNLSNCMIESLHSLSRNPLPAITALNLRGNRLRSLAGIERLLSLERLDLRDNDLTDPTEIARLTSLPEIREIWVSGNPFVKTHSGYRVVIFNLFRRTPGYSEDIIIDGSGPGYTERKQLVDRVAEPEGTPVIRSAAADHSAVVSKPANTAGPGAAAAGPVEGDNGYARRTLPNEYGVESTRRKKGHRRRIVNTSVEKVSTDGKETPGAMVPSVLPVEHIQLPVDPFVTPSSDRQRRSDGGPQVGSAKVQSPEKVDSDPGVSSQPMNESFIPRAVQDLDWNVDGKFYRRQLEALKHDVGNTWLHALGDRGWDQPPRDINVPRTGVNLGDSAIIPAEALTRANNLPILSGGRP